MKKITSALVLAFGLFIGTVSAQNISGKSASVTVDGTSSLHDWTMSASTATFSGTVNGNAINNVKFAMPTKNLKSKKGKMMDNKAYNALNADKAPNITFTASSINVGKGNATGQLSIAGTTKNVTFPVSVSKSGNAYTISGNTTVKMSDYGMKTPGFMGVKTGDAVTIKVNIVAE
ncbi:MAG: YceI family protein [Myroides sp.]|nr:YceI family protein [Myroides sp.]